MPQSPYAVSKLYAYWITKIYRDSYGLFASNGILFNHESPYRGETFVTKKIVSRLVKISKGSKKILYLGNLDSKRDWGHAKDYVRGQWLIMNHKKADDFVLSTGITTSVRKFTEITAKKLNIKIKWINKGLKEKGIDISNNKVIIAIDKNYYRPLEVDFLKGNYAKAKKELNWKPKYNLNMLIDEMINFEKKNNFI